MIRVPADWQVQCRHQQRQSLTCKLFDGSKLYCQSSHAVFQEVLDENLGAIGMREKPLWARRRTVRAGLTNDQKRTYFDQTEFDAIAEWLGRGTILRSRRRTRVETHDPVPESLWHSFRNSFNISNLGHETVED